MCRRERAEKHYHHVVLCGMQLVTTYNVVAVLVSVKKHCFTLAYRANETAADLQPTENASPLRPPV
jgi:hypothetical protein